MGSARGEPEQHVAGFDPGAVDRFRLFHDADGEAGEIVFSRHECVRMLGGLAADERAARELASFRDPTDHIRSDADIEPFAHVVVEEEKRFRALHEDVVDTHRDQVDADGVMAVESERELELRAHSVGPGNEDRLAVALGELDQCAEPADPRQHFRPHRPCGKRA
jgi:hypothetical protein